MQTDASAFHIAEPLKLKGELTSSSSVHLSTVYSGKIKTKKELTLDSKAEIRGEIRGKSLKLLPGAKVYAEVQIGSRLPQWFKLPFSFKKTPPVSES